MTCSILLDYAVSFTTVAPTNAASTAHLRNLGIVVKPTATPAAAVIGAATGDTITPATIELSGLFAAGTILDGIFTADSNPNGNAAPLTLLEDAPADVVAALWADLIKGIDQLTAVANGSTIELRAFAGGTAVSVADVTVDITGASPIAPAVVEITDSEDLAGYTDNADVIAAYDGGLNRIYLILAPDVADIPALVTGAECKFFTVYGSTDYLMTDYVTALASFQGNKACSSNLQTEGAELAANYGWCVFYEDTEIATEVRAYFGIYAFAMLLSSNGWRNQQYIPINPDMGLPVESLGLAESLFEDRLSFYLTDAEQGTRLSFFVAGGASITDRYIEEELAITMQSDMLQYLSATQPFNLLVNRLQLEQIGQAVITDFINDGYLDPDGTNTLTITESNEAFKVNGDLTTRTSEALWRVDVDSMQSVGV